MHFNFACRLGKKTVFHGSSLLLDCGSALEEDAMDVVSPWVGVVVVQ